MNRFKHISLNIALFAFIPYLLFCQNNLPIKECILTTQSKNKFVGHIKQEFSDTIIFELNTGDELLFKQNEIASVFPINSEKENVPIKKCGIFDVYIEGREAIYSDQISITMNRGSAKSNKFLGVPFDTEKIRWIEFLEEDCEDGKMINNYSLKTKNNELYIGQILSIDSSGVTMYKPGFFQKKTPFTDIIKLRHAKFRPDMFGHEEYLFMGATGFNLKKKERIAQSTNFLHNSISFGILNNFSLSSGLLFNNGFLRTRLSNDFGKYIHVSVSGGIYWTSSFEYGAAVSIGVPDYFINGGYGKLNGKIFKGYENAEACHIGASIRIWRAGRIIAEFFSLSNDNIYFSDPRDINRERRNFFNWGYNFINRRASLGIYYSLHIKEAEESIGSGRDRYEKIYLESMPKFGISAKVNLKKKKK